MKAFWEAKDWAKNRELNLDWIQHKQSSLDDKGVYILTDDQRVIELTKQEKKWNLELREQADEGTAASADRPAASSSPLPTTQPQARAPDPAPSAAAPPPQKAMPPQPPWRSNPVAPFRAPPPPMPRALPKTIPGHPAWQTTAPWHRKEQGTEGSQKRSKSATSAARNRAGSMAKAKAESADM